MSEPTRAELDWDKMLDNMDAIDRQDLEFEANEADFSKCGYCGEYNFDCRGTCIDWHIG